MRNRFFPKLRLTAPLVAGGTILAVGLASCGDGTVEPPPPPPSPIISLSKSAVTLTQAIGSSATADAFDVTNSGAGTLNWSVGADQSWVSASPGSGSLSSGATATVSVGTNGAILGTGSYQAGLTVSGNAGNSPQTVAAALTVTQTSPLALADGTPFSGLGGGPSSEILFEHDLPGGSGSVVAVTGGASVAAAGQGAASASLASSQAAVLSLLRVTLSGGSGNADLFVRQGTPPTATSFDCASTEASNDESCELANPAGGSWFVLVRGVSAFEDATASLQFLDDVDPASIQLSPASIAVEAPQGSDASETLTITNPGDFTLSWTAEADEEWIDLSPASGSVAPGSSLDVEIAISSSSLATGSYSGTITVSDLTGTATPQSATVDLTVAPAAVIELDQSGLNFNVLEGADPNSQTFTITNGGGLTLNWSTVDDRTWLDLQPKLGTLAPGASGDVTVIVTSSGLVPDSYTGTITVIGENASNTPQAIAVALTVLPVPTIELDPNTLDFTTDEGTNPADQPFEVRNTGEAELNWTATPDESWISLTPSEGSVAVGGSTTVTVSISATSLAPDTYEGTITVTDPNASNSPQTVDVDLAVIPEGFRQLKVSGMGSGAGNVTSTPAGIDCELSGPQFAGTCSGFFQEDSDVTLEGLPGPGNEFTEWFGDCTGGGSCVVTMDQNRAVTAQFDDPFMDIDIRFTLGSTPTEAQEAAFTNAESRWEEIIAKGVPDIPLDIPARRCGSDAPAVAETVDDLVIFATVTNIDGAGGILGQAGPCFLRGDSRLPILGLMRFDKSDLAALELNGTLEDVILHEMGHVLGIGVIWDDLDLLAEPSLGGGQDPHFTGPEAIEAFDAMGGGPYTGKKVPVENFGGRGTADSHWRESVLDLELMTGFIDQPPNPLTRVTVSALADMGYEVDITKADFYSIILNLRASGSAGLIQLKNDIWDGQIYLAGPDGTVRRVEDGWPVEDGTEGGR